MSKANKAQSNTASAKPPTQRKPGPPAREPTEEEKQIAEDLAQEFPSIADSPDELLGVSEYSVNASGHLQGSSSGQAQTAYPREERLSVDPEDLGRRALEDATQDAGPAPEETDEPLPAEESPHLLPGEENMRNMVPDGDTSKDPLITRMPDRSEFERENSERAKRILQQQDDESE